MILSKTILARIEKSTIEKIENATGAARTSPRITRLQGGEKDRQQAG